RHEDHEAADQEEQVDAVIAEAERDRRLRAVAVQLAIQGGVVERDDGERGEAAQGIELHDARGILHGSLQAIPLPARKAGGAASYIRAAGPRMRRRTRYNRRSHRRGRMRILVVTSQFPLAGEPTRGPPIHQTVRELARLADVRVLSPMARYPRWAQPRSYLFRAPAADEGVAGCDVAWPTYPALPALSRPFNGWMCARAIRAGAAAFAPDVIL